jgi:HPt (histidine-containing phosphotransfer) domain-containing protein
MQQGKKTYPFQFEKSIDADYMYSMYENDYPYIEKIFAVTLSHFIEDQKVADQNYSTEDLEGLRKIFHKIKATFGFIGMLQMQEDCGQMEAKCLAANSFEKIKVEIEELLQKIKNNKILLESELERLKIFNLQSL